jgi:GntR family transcriptional repressor for pyruvate dehydrogenase complex
MTLHPTLFSRKDSDGPTNHRRSSKISDGIIQNIRELFISGQLNPGDRLGSERELIDAFSVSKSTLREALRVLEAMGILEIRKGLMGGVFVSHVDMKTTISSIQGFLRFESASIHDLTMLRYLLEPSILYLAIFHSSEIHIAKLKQIVQESKKMDLTNDQAKGIGFHRYLARMTQNPMLILIMDFIDNLLEDMKKMVGLGPDFYSSVYAYHESVLACMIQENIVEAQKIIIQDILFGGEVIAGALKTEAFKPDAWKINNELNCLTPAYLFSALQNSEATRDNEMFFKKVGTGEVFKVVLNTDT